MKLSSQRFGELDIREDKIITFPEGLVGLPEFKKFVILDHEGNGPLNWLLSLDEPELAFVIIDPTTFLGEYKIELTKVDVEKLQLDDDTETAVFALVVIPDNPQEMTANTKGPIVINVKKMIGRQVIQDSEKYYIKHRIFPEGMAAKLAETQGSSQKATQKRLARVAL